jgi:hypothetical protein
MITFIIIFVLKFIDCLLNSIGNKTSIYGYDRLSNIIKSINWITGVLVLSKVLIDKSLIPVAVAGCSDFIGREVGVYMFRSFQKRREEAKTYQFTIKFKLLETCEFVEIQLKEQGIKTIVNKNNKTIKAISLNKEHSNIIKATIEDKYKNYSVNEFVEYMKK